MAAATFNLVGTFKGLSLSSSSSSFLRGNLKELSTVSGSSVTFPARLPMTIESAHKKGSASTKNGRDSQPKHRGVKIYGDQAAKAGSIIVRQCGTKFHPGNNVGLGRDYTIYSLIDGMVKFEKYGPKRKKISVYPRVEVPENPNSYRARRREFFRLQRERMKAKKKARKASIMFSRKLVLASPKKASAVAALC